MTGPASIYRKLGQRARLIIIVVIAFALGLLLRGGGGSQAPDGHEYAGDAAATAEIWTCSMHPQIRNPGPGSCPLCGMDLIPVIEDTAGGAIGDRELKLSPLAEKLAEIRTVPATRRFVDAELRLVGRIAYDETRIKRISAWVPGRLDRLYVDYTGTRVAKGDHLVELYSPELISAQEELIQALTVESGLSAGASAASKRSVGATVRAAREKLALLGFEAAQILELEKRGSPADHVTIYAPVGGIVIHKNAVQGSYVSTGSPIYTIADLSKVWVMLDAYESDLPWLRYGQTVEFKTDAHPGKSFDGQVVFIDPILDEKTRTVKVRVNVDNEAGMLKPGMFVRSKLFAKLAEGGEVMGESLVGKWIGPMHPEIVKDGPGDCDICGMPLASAESLGYVKTAEGAAGPPLVIPASAPLITGTRSVVYVKDPERPGIYEGREVTLGVRAGDFYLVSEGLAEGEEVVVSGNFKIDSALQILAKPSMMSPDGGVPVSGHAGHGDVGGGHAGGMEAPAEESFAPQQAPAAFMDQLEAVYDAYFDLHYYLSEDDQIGVKKAVGTMELALRGVDMSLLEHESHMVWMKLLGRIDSSRAGVAAGDDIALSRVAFEPLSNAFTTLAETFGRAGDKTVLLYHCPMAFGNKGADWLQEEKGTANPYFGASMYKCGIMKGDLMAAAEDGDE